MSMSSIMMRPDSGRITHKSDTASVDLPLPVRPMTAVVEPPGIRREMLDKEGSRWGA